VDGTEPDLRNEAAGVLLSVVEIAIEEGGWIRQWCVKYVEIVE